MAQLVGRDGDPAAAAIGFESLPAVTHTQGLVTEQENVIHVRRAALLKIAGQSIYGGLAHRHQPVFETLGLFQPHQLSFQIKITAPQPPHLAGAQTRMNDTIPLKKVRMSDMFECFIPIIL